MTVNNNEIPLVPTHDEVRFAKIIAYNFRVFQTAAHIRFGEEYGDQLFSGVMEFHRGFYNDMVAQLMGDHMSDVDAGMLIHDRGLGYLVQYYAENLRIPIPYNEAEFAREFFSPDVRLANMNSAAEEYTKVHTWGEFCNQEIERRFLAHPDLRSFLKLARGYADNEDFHIVKEKVSGIMRKLFVLSEKHSSEHENEKQAMANLAISEIAHERGDKIDKNPHEALSQLASILDGESMWKAKKNPLLYYTNAVKGKFINEVEKQVSDGRHWNALEDKDKKEMAWLDSEENSIELEQPPVAKYSDPGEEETDVKNLLNEVGAQMSDRIADVVRTFYDAYANGEERPKRKKVSQDTGISTRQLRRNLSEVNVFLEHEIEKDEN